jgi:anti-sigma-K factor RskA
MWRFAGLALSAAAMAALLLSVAHVEEQRKRRDEC